jgi:hypothetical protein
MCVFSWQAILDKILTRINLSRRGVIQQVESKDCLLRRNVGDNSQHILLHCNFASGVWYVIRNWLGVMYITPPNLFISFASMTGMGVLKRVVTVTVVCWCCFCSGLVVISTCLS